MTHDPPHRLPKPHNYGHWWNNNQLGLQWYQEIFGVRKQVHEYFIDWFDKLRERQPIETILEVGCGRGFPYTEVFKEYAYTGIDISAKEIEWCRQEDRNPQHRFWCGDFLSDDYTDKADLAFSHAVIDHVYDINRFLERIVSCANRAIFVTAFRGWFPNLEQHRYNWEDALTCFNNDVSASEARGVLTRLGCEEVRVAPLRVDNRQDDIDWETVIVARV